VRFTTGASVRFDRASRARLVSAGRIELDAGATYVDSGTASPRLEIVTPFGVVRNVGTQFEVRLSEASLRVRVRSGIVEVHRGADVASARPGTELTLGPGLATSRTAVPYGEDWAWVERLAPVFEIEGRSLAAFLEHVCREQGWTLAYADPRLARDASGIMLHGSTAGLQPSDALAVVMKTSGLTHKVADGELTVARSDRP
jgi:ferric-dicitrate binding protein FerR (iron transport regulator)